MTTYPPTHLLNPEFKYASAHETRQPGYLAMKFARIVAAHEVAEAESIEADHDHQENAHV